MLLAYFNREKGELIMRSYTSKDGDRIEVSEEHLETAVKLKKELQNSSPSGKASLKKIVKMMEKEGFYDAESSENYRQLIKRYQKSIGELPDVVKYADMVADNKLESIKELVGDIAYEKRENQQFLTKINKGRRELIDFSIIAENIRKTFEDYDWSEVKFVYNPIQSKSNKKMIVSLTDLHVGALVETDVNTYNYEVAQKRMQEYLDKVITITKDNGINEVYLMNVGDAIENPYMHNLMYSTEFTLSEQIAKASDLIIKFMVGLSEHVYVTVAGIGGNHDRMHEDKHKSLNGDHAVKGINVAIKSYIENSKIERIKYEQAKDYEHSIELNGVHIKFVHGDLDNANDPNLIAKHISLDNKNYSLIIMGHYHHHRIIEQGIEKFIVMFGSLKGADDYGQNKRKVSSVSQGVIIISEDGEIDIRRVKLT